MIPGYIWRVLHQMQQDIGGTKAPTKVLLYSSALENTLIKGSIPYISLHNYFNPNGSNAFLNSLFLLFGTLKFHRVKVILVKEENLDFTTVTILLRYGCVFAFNLDIKNDIYSRCECIPYGFNVVPVAYSRNTAMSIRRAVSYLVTKRFKNVRSIGSEHESSTAFTNVELDGRVKEPYGYKSPINADDYLVVPKMKFHGVSKLWNISVPFLNTQCDYIGGSPGSSLVNHKTGSIRIIDPFPLDIRLYKNILITHIQDVFRYEYVRKVDSLLIDIRTDDFSRKHNEDSFSFATWMKQKSIENVLSSTIYWLYKQLNPYMKSIIKFDPGLNLPPCVPGSIYFEPYYGGGRESRIGGEGYDIIGFNANYYTRILEDWQKHASLKIMSEQGKRLGMLNIKDVDFNLETYAPNNGAIIAMYSISNTHNKKQLVDILSRKYPIAAIIPRMRIHYNERQNIQLSSKDKDENYTSNREVLDYLFSPSDILKYGLYMYNILDIIIEAGRFIPLPFDPTDENIHNWVCVSNFHLLAKEPLDLVNSSQTHFVRLLTRYLQSETGYSRMFFHDERVSILRMFESSYDMRGIQVNQKVYDVAGHLFHAILLFETGFICIKRFLEHEQFNFERSPLVLKEQIKDLLAESRFAYQERWHSKLEYQLGLMAAVGWRKQYGLPNNYALYNFIAISINAWKDQ